jgi:hypothetical protein
MTDLVLLTDEEIADMSYDSFNKTDLVAMQSMQESEFPRYTVAMAHTIYVWENILYQEASRLCESYDGEYGKLKTAFGLCNLIQFFIWKMDGTKRLT